MADTDDTDRATTPFIPVSPSSSKISPNRRVIYINLIVVDASGAIASKLSTKTQDMPKPLASLATNVATKLATPERVAGVMEKELPKKMVQKMASKGFTAVAETIFREGPYVVVQLQLQHADTSAMAAAMAVDTYDEDDETKIEQKAVLTQDWAARIQMWLQTVFSWIGGKRQRNFESDYLPRIIQSKMEEVMNDLIADKLEEKGVNAISRVMKQEEQARYFFDTIACLRAAKAEKRQWKPPFASGKVIALGDSVKKSMRKAKQNVENTKPKLMGFKPPFGKKVV